MTEPDKRHIRLVTDAVSRELKRVYTPAPVPIPEDEDDGGWRAILEDFERRFRQARDEESER